MNCTKPGLEELRLLANLQHRDRLLIQICLIGQEQLRDLVHEPQMEHLRQRIIAGYHLRPLDRQELQAYVEHRLALVGGRNDPSISDAAFDAVFAATGGVPRRVNNLCDRLLLFGSLEEVHEIEDSHVQTVVEEMAQEVGHSESQIGDEAAPAAAAQPTAHAHVARPADLEGRVAFLEQEVHHLRSALSKNRRMLKQAIMLHMDADEDDDGF